MGMSFLYVIFLAAAVLAAGVPGLRVSLTPTIASRYLSFCFPGQGRIQGAHGNAPGKCAREKRE